MTDAPLLADLVQQWTFKRRDAANAMNYRQWLRAAPRFVVDDDMVERMAETGADLKQLNQRLWLARLPFEKMWIEYDLRQFVRCKAKYGKLAEALDQLDQVPPRAGFLLVRDPAKASRFIVFQFLDMDGEAAPAPITHFVDTEEPIDRYYSQFGVETLPRFILPENYNRAVALFGERALALHGGRTDGFDAEDDAAQRIYDMACAQPLGVMAPEEVEDTHEFFRAYPWYGKVIAGAEPGMKQAYRQLCDGRVADWQDKLTRLMNAMVDLMKEDRGVVRHLVTLLAMINEVPTITLHKERPGYRAIGMNKVRYFDYNQITLKLPKMQPQVLIDRYLKNASRDYETRRRHSVRGHWRNSHRTGRRSCEHSYVQVKPDHYECQTCAHQRWWINEFERGDAAKGYVVAQYKVEAS